MAAIEWVKGDRLNPLVLRLVDDAPSDFGRNPDPVDLTGKTVTLDMDDSAGTAVISAGACTAHPTQAFTVDTVDDRILCVGHGYRNGWQIQVSTSGGLPGGLTSGTRYYVEDATPNDFRIVERPGAPPSDFSLQRQSGEVVDITSAGTGTQSMWAIGMLSYTFAANDVDATGSFYLWVKVTSGGVFQSFPNDDGGQELVIYDRP